MGSPSPHHYTPLANTGTLGLQAQKGPEVIFGRVPTEYRTAGALIFIQAGSSSSSDCIPHANICVLGVLFQTKPSPAFLGHLATEGFI